MILGNVFSNLQANHPFEHVNQILQTNIHYTYQLGLLMKLAKRFQRIKARRDDRKTLLKHWPRGYKTFFKLSSAEHEISTAHKC